MEIRSVETGRKIKHECCLLPNLFNLYVEYLTKLALEYLGDFRIGGQVIGPMKYANNGLLAKYETIIQGMTDRLIESGGCYVLEMNVEKD
jgi:hypothetical protein